MYLYTISTKIRQWWGTSSLEKKLIPSSFGAAETCIQKRDKEQQKVKFRQKSKKAFIQTEALNFWKDRTPSFISLQHLRIKFRA